MKSFIPISLILLSLCSQALSKTNLTKTATLVISLVLVRLSVFSLSWRGCPFALMQKDEKIKAGLSMAGSSSWKLNPQNSSTSGRLRQLSILAASTLHFLIAIPKQAILSRFARLSKTSMDLIGRQGHWEK